MFNVLPKHAPSTTSEGLEARHVLHVDATNLRECKNLRTLQNLCVGQAPPDGGFRRLEKLLWC